MKTIADAIILRPAYALNFLTLPS